MGYMVGPLFDIIPFTTYRKVEDTVTGWTNYIKNLFSPNQRLSALNPAGANIHSLVTPVSKERVVLNIPYFPYGNHALVTIDGQSLSFCGSATDPNGTNARVAGMKWHEKTQLAESKAANYQNLQLVLLYWNAEQIPLKQPGEKELLQAAEQTAHNNNLALFRTPSYGANESIKWN